MEKLDYDTFAKSVWKEGIELSRLQGEFAAKKEFSCWRGLTEKRNIQKEPSNGQNGRKS